MQSGHDSSNDSPPPNHPFAALRALRSQLPEGPPPVETTSKPTTPAQAEVTRIVVRRERKGHGGKTATRVQRLELNAEERALLCKEVKRALGCGARWDGDDLLMQGDLLERAAQWFEKRGHRVVRGN